MQFSLSAASQWGSIPKGLIPFNFFVLQGNKQEFTKHNPFLLKKMAEKKGAETMRLK